MVALLARQSEIPNSIAKMQAKSMLPNKQMNSFDGKGITKYKPFIINFRHHIQEHCDNDRDKFRYLLQYTSDRPYKLVASCCQNDSHIAYRKARELLDKEFDNEFKVSTAYLKK